MSNPTSPNETFSIADFVKEAQSVVPQWKQPHEKQLVLKKLMLRFFTENHIDQVEKMLHTAEGSGELVLHYDEVMSLVYYELPPRFQSGVFNHVAPCVTLTLKGNESNQFYVDTEDGKLKEPLEGHLEHTRQRDVPAGQALDFPGGVIRSIENKSDETTKVLVCHLGNIVDQNARRFVYEWTTHTKLPYSWEAVVEHGKERMKAKHNDAGLRASDAH